MFNKAEWTKKYTSTEAYKKRHAAKQRKYYAEHKDYYAAYRKVYQVEHKDYYLMKSRLRGARKRLMLREEVILKYSKGTCACVNCGGDVEQLHHANPKNGAKEKKLFGSNTSIEARQYQLKKYKSNPEYIQPLCIECHRATHKKLRKVA